MHDAGTLPPENLHDLQFGAGELLGTVLDNLYHNYNFS